MVELKNINVLAEVNVIRITCITQGKQMHDVLRVIGFPKDQKTTNIS